MRKEKKTISKDRLDYLLRYTQENYVTFGAKVKKEEYEELKELLRTKGMTNADFIRWATEKLRSI